MNQGTNGLRTDSMGDCSADSYQTWIFQCLIPMDNHPKNSRHMHGCESPSGHGPLGPLPGWGYYHMSIAMQYSNTALETTALVMHDSNTFFYVVSLLLMTLRIS